MGKHSTQVRRDGLATAAARISNRLGFDTAGFLDEFDAVCKNFGISRAKALMECGVDDEVIRRLRAGESVAPSGPVLAALCAWSGIQPGLYSIVREQPVAAD